MKEEIKIKLTPEEEKRHEEFLRGQAIMNEKEGERARKLLEKVLEEDAKGGKLKK